MLENVIGHGARDDQVFAQGGIGGLVVGQNLSHGLDVCGVEFVEFADVFEDFVDLRAVGIELGVAQIEISQVGNAQDVFTSNLHGNLPVEGPSTLFLE
jgi:hypothetical protein